MNETIKLARLIRTLGEMVQDMADVYGRYTGGPEW